MAFKLGKERRQIRNPKDTPIFRKKLEKGTLGKANNDGSIHIDKSVEPFIIEGFTSSKKLDNGEI